MSIDLPTSAIPPATAAVPRSGPFLVRLQVSAAAIALLLSAFLLFSVQPMFTKMVLPRLGGSPATWSVALVVFQALLLGGYLYAHLLARHLGTRAALAVHLGLMLVAALALPIGLRQASTGRRERTRRSGSSASSRPRSGCRSSPFRRTGRCSRPGSPLGPSAGRRPLLPLRRLECRLLRRAPRLPLLIEPLLTLRVQAEAWVAGFAVLGLLILASGLASGTALPASPGTPAPALASPHRAGHGVGPGSVSPSCPPPSCLGHRPHLDRCRGGAPPLVAPLALFLLTFVIAFRDGWAGPARAPAPPGLGHRARARDFVVGVGLWGGSRSISACSSSAP